MYYFYRPNIWRYKGGYGGNVSEAELEAIRKALAPQKKQEERKRVRLRDEIAKKLKPEPKIEAKAETECEQLEREGITEDDILHFIFCLEGDE